MLNVGAASIITTPELGTQIQGGGLADQPARRVRDDLEANALFLTDGQTPILLVSCDIGPQRVELGRGTVHETLGDDTILSLTPHDYVRGRGNRFFQGKTLVSGDGEARTRIQETTYGTPFEVRVNSVAGFESGEGFHYVDLAPGDDFVIRNWAAATSKPDGGWQITATDDVTLTIDGRTITPR
jgi:hypothetical protein